MICIFFVLYGNRTARFSQNKANPAKKSQNNALSDKNDPKRPEDPNMSQFSRNLWGIKCNFCDLRFRTDKEASNHLLAFHEEKMPSKESINVVLENSELNGHIISEEPNKCVVCENCALFVTDLEGHVCVSQRKSQFSKVHEGKMLPDRKDFRCNTATMDVLNLNEVVANHVFTVHEGKMPTELQNSVDKESLPNIVTSNQAVTNHNATVHEEKLPPENIYSQAKENSNLDNNEIIQTQNCENNSKSHHEKPTYKCFDCDYAGESMKLLIFHMSALHGTEVHEGKIRYRCFHCDNPFDQMQLLKLHVFLLNEDVLRGYQTQTYNINSGLESSKSVVADQNSTVHDQKKSAEKPKVSNVHEGRYPIEQQTGETDISTCSKDHEKKMHAENFGVSTVSKEIQETGSNEISVKKSNPNKNTENICLEVNDQKITVENTKCFNVHDGKMQKEHQESESCQIASNISKSNQALMGDQDFRAHELKIPTSVKYEDSYEFSEELESYVHERKMPALDLETIIHEEKMPSKELEFNVHEETVPEEELEYAHHETCLMWGSGSRNLFNAHIRAYGGIAQKSEIVQASEIDQKLEITKKSKSPPSVINSPQLLANRVAKVHEVKMSKEKVEVSSRESSFQEKIELTQNQTFQEHNLETHTEKTPPSVLDSTQLMPNHFTKVHEEKMPQELVEISSDENSSQENNEFQEQSSEHHDEKIKYNCFHCNDSFDEKDCLYAHIFSNHEEKSSDTDTSTDD